MSESESEIQASSTSPGKVLKKLREEKNLTVSDVSSRLRLDPRIIEGLETDNFDAMPAATYVRGYIRNYAKLLKANPDEFVDAYNDLYSEEDPEIVPEIKHPTQTSSSDKPVKVFTYLLTLGLVILLIAWWQSNYLLDKTSSVTVVTSPADNAINIDEQDSTDILTETTAEPSIEDNVSVTDVMEISQKTNLQRDSSEPVTLPLFTESTLTAETEISTEIEPVVTSDSTGPDTITLTLSNDSWVEVFDGNGEKVFLNLGRADQTLILHGTAPFSVLLGFAQGVIVEFNGEPFDASAYSRAGVARFTLE